MEVKRNQLKFIPLEKEEYKQIRDEGCICRTKGKETYEHWQANPIASFTIDGEYGVFDITMTQIGVGDVVPSSTMGILEKVESDEPIGVVYEVDATVASKGYPQADKFFTELTEAIDYYNKIKAFFKAEVKPYEPKKVNKPR